MHPRPIREIFPSPRYRNSFRKLEKKIQERLIEREKLFRSDAYYPGIKTHKLEGDFGNEEYHAYYVDDTIRVFFKFVGSDKVLYIDVGDHRLYRG